MKDQNNLSPERVTVLPASFGNIPRRRARQHCLRFSRGTWVAIIALALSQAGTVIGYVQTRFAETQESTAKNTQQLIEIDKRFSVLDEKFSVLSLQGAQFAAAQQQAARNEQRLEDLQKTMERVLDKLDKLPAKTATPNH